MPEEVYINEESRTIHIKSTGGGTIEDLKKSLSLIIKFRNEKGFIRIFVDHREATSFPSHVPAFNFGADVVHLLKGTSIATVSSYSSETDINFFKNVVTARGGNVQIFHSSKPALKWLSDQPG